ncbi:MAG: FlgD immunoglobulin-like domain containing protein [bacterium]
MRISSITVLAVVLLVLVAKDDTYSQSDFWEQTSGPPASVRQLVINQDGTLFASTSGGVFRSADVGDSWESVNNGLTSINTWGLGANLSGDLFVGTAPDSSVFRSTNNGSSWQSLNIELTNSFVVTFDVNSNGVLFAGTIGPSGLVGDGIFRSTDNGDNWVQINNGLTVASLSVRTIAINSNGVIFAGTSNGGVFRSSDNGDNWTEVNNGLTGLFVSDLAISPNGDLFAASGSGFVSVGGVFRSTDNGENWEFINNGLTNDDVRSLAIATNGHLFAGTWGGSVFRSTDNGDNWMPINSGLSSDFVGALAINRSGNIFAGTLADGVFRSVQPVTAVEIVIPPGDPAPISFRGTQITLDFESGPGGIVTVNEIPTFPPLNADMSILSDGVKTKNLTNLRNIDSGQNHTSLNQDTLVAAPRHWEISSDMQSGTFTYILEIGYNAEEFPDGLTEDNVTILFFDPDSSDYIELSTITNADQDSIQTASTLDHFGLFALGAKISSVTKVEQRSPTPDKFTLFQNYPNPFNPETTIKYEISKSAQVKLEIFNILGQEIRTLVDKEKSAGFHAVLWDGEDNQGRDVPSGLYLYQIKVGNFLDSKKMLLLR